MEGYAQKKQKEVKKMSRPRNKADLIMAAIENFEKLIKMIEEMSSEEKSTIFDFSGDEKKKEAHWGRDKNVRDVLIHLWEWHKLLLRWIKNNRDLKNVKIQFLGKEILTKNAVSINQPLNCFMAFFLLLK